MKRLFILLLFTCFFMLSFAQNNSPKEITPQVLQKIKTDVERLIPTYKQSLVKKGLNADETEFSIDTFRISQIVTRRIDIDYSTVGMNITVDEMTGFYDKLMNKYYNKLLKALQQEDKRALINAQKAWLAYRDAEAKLIGVMTKDAYSGGGTIQTNIATGAYADLVIRRTIEIFNYYNGILKE